MSLKTFDRIIIFIEFKKYIQSQKFYIHKIDGHLDYHICKLKMLFLNDKLNVKYCINDLIFIFNILWMHYKSLKKYISLIFANIVI